MAKIDAIDVPKLTFPEAAAPGTPAASKVVIYAKSDGLMYSKDDAGAETVMSGGGGGGALVLLEQHTASSSATLDFTTFISSTYDTYKIEIVSILPATNSVGFFMRMGTGGGPTYDTGANYGWVALTYRAAATSVTGADTGATAIQLGFNTTISNGSTGGVNGSLTLYDPQSASAHKQVTGTISIREATPLWIANQDMGIYQSTTAVTAVRFYFSSGNIASGTIRIYGVAK